MGRILAIDYGTKRVGVAVTDENQIIATGLTTVREMDVLDFLKQYVSANKVDCIVIGDPAPLKGEGTEMKIKSDQFSKKVLSIFPGIVIERFNERFTSLLAQRAILESVPKKSDRRDKGLVDQVSATILLQEYLDLRKKNQGSFS